MSAGGLKPRRLGTLLLAVPRPAIEAADGLPHFERQFLLGPALKGSVDDLASADDGFGQTGDQIGLVAALPAGCDRAGEEQVPLIRVEEVLGSAPYSVDVD